MTKSQQDMDIEKHPIDETAEALELACDVGLVNKTGMYRAHLVTPVAFPVLTADKDYSTKQEAKDALHAKLIEIVCPDYQLVKDSNEILSAIDLTHEKYEYKIFSLQDEIAQLKAAKEDAWIPVSERLPDEHESVLAKRDIGDAHQVVIAFTFNEKGKQKWNYQGFLEPVTKVTHWMPLPKPPQDKQGE